MFADEGHQQSEKLGHVDGCGLQFGEEVVVVVGLVQVLREAGVIQQRQEGTRRVNTLREEDLEARVDSLPDWLHGYNHHRPHTALAGKPPASRVTNVPRFDS